MRSVHDPCRKVFFRQVALITLTRQACSAGYSHHQEDIMPEQETHARVQTSESVKDVQAQDGSVLLDIAQGTCYSLNPVGARIWQMLKAGADADSIVATLATEFDVSRHELYEDVKEFIQNLQTQKLLTAEPACPATDGGSWILKPFRRMLSVIRPWDADKPGK